MKSLLQTQEWVDLKVSQGWKSHEVDGVYVLEKPLPFGLSFLYSPEVEYTLLRNTKIYKNTKEIAQKSHSIFFRLEILDEFDKKIIQNLKKEKFIKAFEELQPEWRQIIDISGNEEEILAQMKPKGRYNIKIAQKHGVEITVCPIDRLLDGVEVFYDLYKETGKSQKFETRSKKYFLELVKALYPKGMAAILIARYQNVPLSALIITFYGMTASYLYGGTSRVYKNVMAPYLAHWEAIRLAKEKGCQYYDLLAVAPPQNDIPQSAISNPQEGNINNFLSAESGSRKAGWHKYSGITQFKEQFGGRKVNLVGNWDLVYKPVWYKLFKFAEKLRRR